MKQIPDRKPFFFFLIYAALLGLLDQITKELARIFLDSTSNITIIPGFIKLTYIENTGISFGMLSGLPDSYKTILLVALPILVITGLTFFIYKNFHSLHFKEKIGYCLIIGGAIGNLYDRAVFSTVTDFTHFLFFGKSLFINNLADDFISIGLIFIVIPQEIYNRLFRIKKRR